MKERARTHQPTLPWPNRPTRDKVFHDENVRNDALVITEREATERSENGAAKRVRVGKQPCQSRWPVRVCVRVVVFAVWMHGERAAAEVVQSALLGVRGGWRK